jgi:hypothetical protein
MNVWRRTHTDTIESEFQRRLTESAVERRRMAALRESVAKDLFSALEPAEKEEWKQKAKLEHDAALAVWKKSMTLVPSSDPADRQS